MGQLASGGLNVYILKPPSHHSQPWPSLKHNLNNKKPKADDAATSDGPRVRPHKRERETERETRNERERETRICVHICICMYACIYVYAHVCVYTNTVTC